MRSRDLRPPGFLDNPSPAMPGRPHWNPSLDEWLGRLDAAFAPMLWATSCVAHSRRLALAAGSARAVGWKVNGRVPPDMQVGVVDDRLLCSGA